MPDTEKRPSRLQKLASKQLPEPTKVVDAGDAIEKDLNATVPPKTDPPKTAKPRVKKSVAATTKRTFRHLPKPLDDRLKRLVRQYNATIDEDETELTLEDIGPIMLQHFLDSEPREVIDKARGKQLVS